MNNSEKIEDDLDKEIIQDVSIVELDAGITGAGEDHRTRQIVEKAAVDVSERETGGLNRKDILILVVDDHTDSAALLSFDLQRQGYRVVTASNGLEAIKIASLMLPNLILMDIGMPELDGLGATSKIRENEQLRTVPVVAVTAFTTAGFRRAAYDVGFDGYITKPVELQQLHELISRLLTQAEEKKTTPNSFGISFETVES